jgi:peptide/nickel transport system ATP-binding protein
MYAGTLVETGPAVSVTDSPRHPYTQLLLAAAPDPDRVEPPSLQGRGAPPSLVSPPGGCRFHPRCPLAIDDCASIDPVLYRPAGASPDHEAACILLPGARSAPGMNSAP